MSLFGGDVPTWGFALKILFTAVTLGSGFVGGEVTPLFVIGATLGATLAGVLDVPVPFLAALGFVAVFAGAANTPLACTIMGVELFGAGAVPYFAAACVISYVFSSHRDLWHPASGPPSCPAGCTTTRPSAGSLRTGVAGFPNAARPQPPPPTCPTPDTSTGDLT
ncbi:MAG: chloride channel protein [Microthrixaceae bacterium]|nr:chloride channel protein [Microthrixaceae bacterium]